VLNACPQEKQAKEAQAAMEGWAQGGCQKENREEEGVVGQLDQVQPTIKTTRGGWIVARS